MHTRIGASGGHGGRVRAGEPAEHALHLPLHGAALRLSLPPGEVTPVVVGDQENRGLLGVIHEPRKLAGGERSFKTSGARAHASVFDRMPAGFPHSAAALATHIHPMAPRSLASLAHALGATADLDGALVALAECVAEMDRGAALALLRYDGRREMLRERLTPIGGRVERTAVETTFDHLPAPVQMKVAAGGQFVDMAERSADYARLFGFTHALDGGVLALRGLRVEGYLAAVLALYEPRQDLRHAHHRATRAGARALRPRLRPLRRSARHARRRCARSRT